MKRHLSAAVFLPVFLVIVLRGPAWALAVLVALAAAFAMVELSRMAERCGLVVQRPLALPLGMAASLLFLTPERVGDGMLLLVVVAAAASLLGGLFQPGRPAETMSSSAATLFTVFYPGVLMSFLVGLRTAEGEMGRQLLLFLMAVIWMSDAGGYYVGKALGRHKLCPSISPNKTVEGALGGIVFGVLAALGWRAWFLPELSPLAPLFAAALVVVGILGDLGESVMKRGAGVKDTAALVPGHGGVLDRVDSLLLAAPLFYYTYRWILV
jgi:phosphatidate cytidylyltransferase